jgi:hypothetical protein
VFFAAFVMISPADVVVRARFVVFVFAFATDHAALVGVLSRFVTAAAGLLAVSAKFETNLYRHAANRKPLPSTLIALRAAAAACDFEIHPVIRTELRALSPLEPCTPRCIELHS